MGGGSGVGEGIKFCNQFEDSDTGSSSSITVKMEYLFVWKTDEGKAESIFLLMLVLLRRLIVGEWGVVRWGRKSYLGPA